MKKNRMNDFSKFLMLAALIILMAGGYIVNRKKLQLREAANLPYYKVELSEIIFRITKLNFQKSKMEFIQEKQKQAFYIWNLKLKLKIIR